MKPPPIKSCLSQYPVNPLTGLGCLIALAFFSSIGCNRSGQYFAAQGTAGLPATTQAATGFGGIFSNSPGFSGIEVSALRQQYEAREAELNRRLQLLDENNRQLQTQLAQSQQQIQLASDEKNLLRRQLQDMSGQLQQSRLAQNRSSEELHGLAERLNRTESDMQWKGGARLTANSSLKPSAAQFEQLGFPTFIDGDVIRLRIPADRIFQTNSTNMTASAPQILDRIAMTIRQNFPRQRVGIEGHTDNGPFYGGAYASAHQLASAQSSSVAEYFTRNAKLPSNQFFTLAHGTNHPVADLQSPAGRAENRRIEIVVYPDSI